jgi:hypothetical protein
MEGSENPTKLCPSAISSIRDVTQSHLRFNLSVRSEKAASKRLNYITTVYGEYLTKCKQNVWLYAASEISSAITLAAVSFCPHIYNK